MVPVLLFACGVSLGILVLADSPPALTLSVAVMLGYVCGRLRREVWS